MAFKSPPSAKKQVIFTYTVGENAEDFLKVVKLSKTLRGLNETQRFTNAFFGFGVYAAEVKYDALGKLDGELDEDFMKVFELSNAIGGFNKLKRIVDALVELGGDTEFAEFTLGEIQKGNKILASS